MTTLTIRIPDDTAARPCSPRGARFCRPLTERTGQGAIDSVTVVGGWGDGGASKET